MHSQFFFFNCRSSRRRGPAHHPKKKKTAGGRRGRSVPVGRTRMRAHRAGAIRIATAASVRLAQRFAMISALVADLLILRPTIVFLRRLTG